MQTRQSKWIPKKHHPSHLEQVVFLVMEACKDQALDECSFIWPPIRTEYLVITIVVVEIGICLESRMRIISFHSKTNWFRGDYWLPFISQTFMCSGRETCYLLFPSSWGGCSTWNVAEAKSIRWTPKSEIQSKSARGTERATLKSWKETDVLEWSEFCHCATHKWESVPWWAVKPGNDFSFIDATAGWKGWRTR